MSVTRFEKQAVLKVLNALAANRIKEVKQALDGIVNDFFGLTDSPIDVKDKLEKGEFYALIAEVHKQPECHLADEVPANDDVKASQNYGNFDPL